MFCMEIVRLVLVDILFWICLVVILYMWLLVVLFMELSDLIKGILVVNMVVNVWV